MTSGRILVCEDEGIIALDLQSLLNDLGYDVPAVVSSGEEAIVKAEEVRPDLVLMDIMLNGELDGTEAAEQIHGKFDIPIVFLTANADENILTRAKKAEPYGYIVKPFKDIQVRAAIEMALHKCQMEAELGNYRVRLEELVDDRTCELKKANEQLQQEFAGRIELEEQLRQSQKMEVLGRLAGGVAHDFNNLLTVITGYADLGMRKLSDQHGAHTDFEQIRSAAERASHLVRQLLIFSRKQLIEPLPLNLNLLIEDTKTMLGRLIGEDIELSTLLAPDLPEVLADSNQLEQVLINLVVNARDAMPHGGQLTIETANVHLGSDYIIRRPEVTVGEYVKMTVRDTGVGMTPEVKGHLFEPFFTTKEVGKGTGLGLATCYGVVKSNQGHMEVDSTPGEGSSFTVYLPRYSSGPAKQPLQDEYPNSPGGSETILLAEDEAGVRAVASLTLRRQGYRVLEATDGFDALRLTQEHLLEGIDLLLTDVIMPGMNGSELATQLQIASPATRVLYTSGYTDDAIGSYGMLDPGTEFLSKPFSPPTLARKVREVLDK